MIGNPVISQRHIKNIKLPSKFEACQAATFIHNVYMYDSYTRATTVTVRQNERLPGVEGPPEGIQGRRGVLQPLGATRFVEGTGI